MLQERKFSAKKRKAMAKKGTAMKDGSFPIANASDLANAIQAVGRATNYAAARRHIIKRARALGLTGRLPKKWGVAEFNPYHDELGRFASATGAISHTWTPGMSLHKQALAKEPSTTARLQRIAQGEGGHMEGLDFRFKDREGIDSKINRNMATEGLTREEASGSISDALRYTAIFNETSYRDGANEMFGALEESGGTVKIKNYWESSNGYRGINATVTEPDGFKWELQIHTQSSFNTKMSNHALYEKARSPSATPAQVKGWEFEMTAVWSGVPTPPNVSGFGMMKEAVRYGMVSIRYFALSSITEELADARGLMMVTDTGDTLLHQYYSGEGQWVTDNSLLGYAMGDAGALEVDEVEAERLMFAIRTRGLGKAQDSPEGPD